MSSFITVKERYTYIDTTCKVRVHDQCVAISGIATAVNQIDIVCSMVALSKSSDR